MRNLITAILTFSIGIFIFAIAVLFEPIPSLDEPPVDTIRINACSLFSNSDHLLDRPIVVNALLFQSYDGILVYTRDGLDCGKPDPEHSYRLGNFDPSVYTTLDLTEYEGPNSDLGHLLKTPMNGWEIEVTIEGTLVRAPSPYFPYKYTLEPIKITLDSSWRPFTAKAAA